MRLWKNFEVPYSNARWFNSRTFLLILSLSFPNSLNINSRKLLFSKICKRCPLKMKQGETCATLDRKLDYLYKKILKRTINFLLNALFPCFGHFEQLSLQTNTPRSNNGAYQTDFGGALSPPGGLGRPLPTTGIVSLLQIR